MKITIETEDIVDPETVMDYIANSLKDRLTDYIVTIEDEKFVCMCPECQGKMSDIFK